MMQPVLHTFKQNRKNIVSLLGEHSLGQVNTTPPGFNNNLLWNAGHLLLSHQFLFYHFSGLPMPDYVQALGPKYGPGTIPDGKASQTDFDLIIDRLNNSADQFIDDYNDGRFKTFKTYTSEYFGITMHTIEEAIQFTICHEAFHFGFMSAIKLGLR
jgi:hypothetical protein